MVSITALTALALPGCRDAPNAGVQQSQQEQLRQADRSEALLKAATNQLNDLPAAVDTEVRPPVVILHSQTSSDHQDVMATCTANPADPNGQINVIRVPAGNSHFRGLGVRPGYLLKFFVLQDKTVDEDSKNSGLSRQVAMELKIAQVLDDNTLVIEGGLNQEVTSTAKIEIWRYVNARLQAIREKFSLYEINRWPPVAWEPAPDEQVLVQILTWLNQWIRQNEPPAKWQPDPLLATLNASLTSDAELAKFVSAAGLTAQVFQPPDARQLQEAVWLRDISRWAHGDSFDEVARATALFDWTIRNIQLEDDKNAAPRRPWQVLLYGRGTAEQRAWVFALLCRQQGLDVVMLGFPPTKPTKPTDDKAATASAQPLFWLPALLSKGQLYLFDARLGLPIPGPKNAGVATLEQVQQDDALLRQLDLEGEPYAVTAAALKNVRAMIVADPFELSRRAGQLEAGLTGDDHLTLAAKPSELASRLKSLAGVKDVVLWDLPFRTLRDQLSLGKSARHDEALAFEPFAVRPALWKARTRQFQGRHKEAATASEDAINDHGEAIRIYTSPSVRPPEHEIAASTSTDERRVISAAKIDATYWIGLLSFDDGKFEVAADWFAHPELAAPGSPWASGARYNQARSLEAQGKFDEAAVILEKDNSPQQHGNKLHARELKSRPKPTKKDK